MRILICGSRNWCKYEPILNALAEAVIDAPEPVECVIEGECHGADLLGKRAAKELGLPVLPFPADWKTYGKSAGFRRNRQMLVEGAPDLGLAFQINHSAGTQDMIDLMLDVGIPVKVFVT